MNYYAKFIERAEKEGTNPVDDLYERVKEIVGVPEDAIHEGVARAIAQYAIEHNIPPLDLAEQANFFKGRSKEDIENYIIGAMAGAAKEPGSRLNRALKEYLTSDVEQALRDHGSTLYKEVVRAVTNKGSEFYRDIKQTLALEGELELTEKSAELEKKYAERERRLKTQEETLNQMQVAFIKAMEERKKAAEERENIEAANGWH